MAPLLLSGLVSWNNMELALLAVWKSSLNSLKITEFSIDFYPFLLFYF
jgi:hypothetical protein